MAMCFICFFFAIAYDGLEEFRVGENKKYKG
jgi:hypothetical protein